MGLYKKKSKIPTGMAAVAAFIIQLLIGTTLSDQKNKKKTINLITFKSVINEALSHYLLYVVWNHGACSMTCVQVFLIKSDYSSYYTAAEVQHPFLKSCPILLSYGEYIALAFYAAAASSSPRRRTSTTTTKLVVISGHIVAQSGTTIFFLCVCVAILKGIISSTLQQSNIISSHTSITGLALCTRLGGKMEYYIESHKIYCILIHTILSNDAEETLSLILSIDYFTKNLVPLQLHFPLAAPVYTTPLTLICCCYRKLLLLQSTQYTTQTHGLLESNWICTNLFLEGENH